MAKIYLVLNWFFGSVFLLIAFIHCTANFFQSMLCFTISFLLLPPARNFIHSKTHKSMPVKTRAILLFILLFTYTIVNPISYDKKEKENALISEKRRQEQLVNQNQASKKTYDKNKQSILEEVRSAIDNKDYGKAFTISKNYRFLKDDELESLLRIANAGIYEKKKAEDAQKMLDNLKSIPDDNYLRRREIYRKLLSMDPENDNYKIEIAALDEKRTQALLSELKAVPASNHEQNLNLYQELEKLNPDNDKYKSKVNYYGKIVKKEQATKAMETNIRKMLRKDILNYEIKKDSVIIKYSISENLTENMTKAGVKLDVKNILQAVHESGFDASEIKIIGRYPMMDKFGNTEVIDVVKVTFTNNTINKINWDNLLVLDVYAIADSVWRHPSFK